MKHTIRHIHFVGLGGTGMSGIAEVLMGQGYKVSGSDQHDSVTLRRLTGLGMRTYVGHDASHVMGADVVVTSSAVQESNAEVRAARARGTPVVPRAVMLAELMRGKQGIAIAGTHGKTTTTSLVTSVLVEAGLDPSFVIGGKLNSAGANARLGRGEHIVVEADESDASFLHLLPMMAVVTNIDADHMETYGHDLGRLRQAFVDFLQRMPFYGSAIVCTDDANVRAIVPGLGRKVVGYGFEPGAQLRAVDVMAQGTQMRFTVVRPGRADLPMLLNVAGRHNVLNALAAIGVGMSLGIADAVLQKALAGFKGVGRRFQSYGELPALGGGEFLLLDDYGHHPVEMAATLAAARGAYPGKRLLLVFQPHRYTRTRDCFADFVRVIGLADGVLLAEVYAAGEAPIAGADGQALVQALRAAGRADTVLVDPISALPAAICAHARGGDVVLCMGAGSISAVPAQVRDMVLKSGGATGAAVEKGMVT